MYHAPTTYTITIGSDDYAADSIAAGLTTIGPDGSRETQGWGGAALPEAEHPTDLDQWVRLAAELCGGLPLAVRHAGLTWNDAIVTPYGWSPDGESAPCGAQITWTIHNVEDDIGD